MAKVTLYRRISVSTDTEPCVAQRERLLAWVAREGHEVIGDWCDDGISGRTISARPGVVAAIDFTCRHRGSILVVTALSRLGRGTLGILETVERLHRAGCSLHSEAETFLNQGGPSSALLMGIVASVSQWEREMICSRTKEQMAWLRRQNRLIGAVPFGMQLADDGQTLVEIPHEQDVLRQMERMRSGGLSFDRIAAGLNDAGHRAKRGGPWTGRAARQVLARLDKLKAA